MKTTRSLRLALVLASSALGLAALPGCTSLQVTDNTEGEVVLGELRAEIPASYARVHAATAKAFKDLGLFQTKDEEEYQKATLKARDNVDNGVTVRLSATGTDVTTVKIRYGTTGDTVESQKLYKAIVNRL